MQLIADGSISETYLGWGFAYPFFPGMEIVVAGSSLMGMEISMAILLIIPILASLIVFPAFLLTTEITNDDRAGLIAAAFIAVVMPHVYPTSHPMPASLGDLLFATCLLLFLKWQRNPKFGFLLFPTTLALIVTHHLSTYFLLISLIFGILLVQLLRNRTLSRRLARELAYLAFAVAAALFYWFLASPGFTEGIVSKEESLFSPMLAAFLALASVLAFLMVYARRRFFPDLVFRYPSYNRILATYVVVLALSLFILSVNALVVVPGTSIDLSVAGAALFLPFILFISFAGSGSRPMAFHKGGLYPLAWTLVISFSTLAGIYGSSKVLIPYRHIEYLMFPLAILVGVGFIHAFGLVHFEKNRRRTGVAVAVALGLVVTNALVAYPPRDVLAGYEEGIKPQVISLARWSGEYTTDLVAADHRVSSMLFGFGNVNATWDTVTLIFHSPDFEGARDELGNVSSPSGRQRVVFVALDQDTVAGVFLYPWDPAKPMSEEAVTKFEELPFQKMYDDGYSKLFFLNWGLA
ncbi:MAG: hypothetical protein ACE5QW_01595 [Thermoplasmata archaeon]